MAALEKMFAPRSVAVIGASRRPGTLGKMFLDAIVSYGYKGQIYPVNPKADEINGIRCYPDIAALPEIPDLAVILIPRDLVLPTVDHLGAAGVKHVVVISAGFRETGDAGRALEEELTACIRKHSMRMIGPNSMGLFNTRPELALNATFSPTPPIPGHVAFISQSGALGVAVLELALRIKLGFSLFVSTGNKADIGDFDVLTYAAQDENTRVIALYQESIDTPDKFRRLAQGTVPDKPILVLKAGRTESGLRAASSHTGALASSDALTDAFLHQCGILRCNDLQEMLYSAYALASQPHPAGNRVGVITNAGGPGILASDALERAGMLLGQIESGTLAGIQQILPAEAGVRNPFDMIASADHNTYYAVFELLEKDPNIDIVMVIIVKPPVDTTPARIVQTLAPLIRKSVKPVYFVLMADPGSDAGLEHFQELGVPVVPYPELAAEIIGNHYRYTILRRNVSIPAISAAATARPVSGGRQAGFHEIAARLEKFDLELAPYQLISHPEEAAGFLKEHKTVVLKVADPEFIHKSDQGLVHLNIGSRQSLNLAFSDLEQKIRHLSGTKKPPEVLIQKMVTGGIELVMGSKSDAVLGPTIMFGIGGIFIELYRDVIFRVLPVTPEDCLEMIESVRGRRIFDGFRNFPAVDKQLLAGAIFRFGELVLNHPDIIEMDLNPVIWSFDQAKPLVVDARMTITI